MSLPVPRIEDPWQQRKPVFIGLGILGLILGGLWIWGSLTTGQFHPAHILRVIHDGHGPVPPPTAPASPGIAAPPDITFHGQVVDDAGTPIPNADVRIVLRDGSSSWQTLDRSTSPDGRFSLHGYRSYTLQVEVREPGYRDVPFPSEGGVISSAEFHYRENPSHITLHDSSAKPLILTLWRPPHSPGPATWEDLRTTTLHPAGAPYEIKIRDRTGAALQTIQLRFWDTRGTGTHPLGNRYSWNASVTVIGGTIIEKDPHQIAPQAPATGYLPAATIDYPHTLPKADWKSKTTRHYYLRFADGSHGLLTLTLDSAKRQLTSGRIIHNPKPHDPDLTGRYLK